MRLELRVFLLFALAGTACAERDGLRVLAAASMEEAVAEIAGPEVELSTGASSVLARQIAAGAPADLYISAGADWVTWLADRNLVRRSALIASNRLVVIAPAGETPDNGRIALADPSHVPAGKYAKAALEAAGRYEPNRIVAAANVRAALALVERGEVDLGVVYATDAALLGDRIRVLETLESPTPIQYAAALLTDRPAARALLERFTSPSARAVFGRHGFLPQGTE